MWSDLAMDQFKELLFIMREHLNNTFPPLIGAEGTRLQRDVRDQGDPTGRKPEEAPGPDRPRKASPCSVDQQLQQGRHF
jgi:hypothetical protein